MEWARKPTTHFSQHSRSPERDMNCRHPHYEARVLCGVENISGPVGNRTPTSGYQPRLLSNMKQRCMDTIRWNGCALHYKIPTKHKKPTKFPCLRHYGMYVEYRCSFSTRWSWIANFMPRPLYPRQRTPVPIKQEFGWAPEPVWAYWRTKNLFLLPAFEVRTFQPVS